jgi:hypothetical protein
LLPNTANSYSKNNLQLEFNNAAFYDTLPLQIQYATHPIKAMALSNQYTINPQLPVHNNYEIALKLLQPIAENLQAKTLMVLKNKIQHIHKYLFGKTIQQLRHSINLDLLNY